MAALDAEEAARPRLPPSDVARLSKSTERRAAHIALRIAIERAAGASFRGREFSIAQGGRPFLEGGPHFSLSHADGAAVIAVGDQPVGIDIERRLRPLRMTEPRRERIRAAAGRLGREPSGTMTVIEAWVRLEAVAKARGTGIGVLLADLGVVGGKQIETAALVDDMHVREVAVGELYVAAIAAAILPAKIDVVTMPTDASKLETFIHHA